MTDKEVLEKATALRIEKWAIRLAHYYPKPIAAEKQIRDQIFEERVGFFRSELNQFDEESAATIRSLSEHLEQLLSVIRPCDHGEIDESAIDADCLLCSSKAALAQARRGK